jgi:hypothetical protein
MGVPLTPSTEDCDVFEMLAIRTARGQASGVKKRASPLSVSRKILGFPAPPPLNVPTTPTPVPAWKALP